ncbi:MAG: hydrogenase 3 maturation endopeptidase HyCI [Candidatus Omnitrophica bacterium]|jgi:hydrogenase maturation protease|nr:hydrogenase 3 maturation endopeptidase HyCI [Candidatus Omnitrophota bacterium]
MSNLLPVEIINVLNFIPESTLVITAGNSFRRDDGVGRYIAARLQADCKVRVIDAGIAPENIVEEVIALAPRRIVVIDAADFGGRPGTVKVIPEEHIPQITLSTHMIPLNVVMPIINDRIRADVCYVGIQPKSVDFGEGLSPEVRQAADALIHCLSKKEKVKREK